MVSYKMLGRDLNASPIQYRTWVVPDQPDYTGQFYTGDKSGPEPLVDITAYAIFNRKIYKELRSFKCTRVVCTPKEIWPNCMAFRNGPYVIFSKIEKILLNEKTLYCKRNKTTHFSFIF